MRKTFGGAAIALALLIALLGMTTRPASAEITGCGPYGGVVSDELRSQQANALGGWHTYTIRLTKSDCDGADRISNIAIQLVKDNYQCGTTVAHVNNYDFNPNLLGDWDPGTVTRTCQPGWEPYPEGPRYTVYKVYFTPPNPIYVYSWQPENVRCIGATIQIDKGPGLHDTNESIPSVCFNGL
jgi:hypothetical protein